MFCICLLQSAFNVCYIVANLGLGRVGRLRTTGYGLEDGQAGTARNAVLACGK